MADVLGVTWLVDLPNERLHRHPLLEERRERPAQLAPVERLGVRVEQLRVRLLARPPLIDRLVRGNRTPPVTLQIG
jgi:hypothetical protein